jgi:acyl dehydratase
MSSPSPAAQTLDALQGRIGQEIHLSDWLEVTQSRIDAFAQATGDHQWIHVDPERAARESPWKSTIAHGYLTLSLYPLLRGLVDEHRPLFPGVQRVINYGLDKLRFPAAVRAGSRVRARCVLLRVEEVAGGLQMAEQYTVEIEGEGKPACVAEAIMRAYF